MLTLHSSPAFGGVVEDLQTLLTKAPDVLSKAAALINKAGPYLPTIENIVEDPAMPQLVQKIQALKALDTGTATPTAPGAAKTPGVGLRRVLPLWDAAILYTKYPWAPWVIGAGTVLVLGGIGFGIGRATKKCHATMGRTYRRKR